jgi:FkbM family methyltransferase
LRRTLTAGDVFIDVGANVGVFTVMAASLVGDRGLVIGFEPSARVLPFLRQNVEKHRNVIIYGVAASCSRGTHPFYEAPATHFGMGSFGSQFGSAATTVDTVSLDEVIFERGVRGRVRMIKVDVEGAEADIFKGCRSLFTTDRPPLIVFEFCDWAEARLHPGQVGAAQQELLDSGFKLFRLGEFLRHRKPRPLRTPIRSGSAMIVAERSH